MTRALSIDLAATWLTLPWSKCERTKKLTDTKLGTCSRYRVGNWRSICDIQAQIVTVLGIEIGHGGEVYRTQRSVFNASSMPAKSPYRA